MFDRVIKDTDWRAALHGRPVMRTEYAGDDAIGRMMLESRVRWILKIRKEGVIPWLQAHGVSPEELNTYALRVCREFSPEE